MAFLPVCWVLCAVLAARVGTATGHENSSFFLGLLLGPLGLLFVATRSELVHLTAWRSRPRTQH